MSDSSFYRLSLEGKKVELSYLELHSIRKDILLYFDQNVGEALDPYLPFDVFKQEYWKYLSINFDDHFGESVSYKDLIERGILALINGITLDILYQPVASMETAWGEQKISFDEIIPYVEAYRPSCQMLENGKTLVLDALNFIEQLTWNDVDENGDIISFDTSVQAVWFDENIVQEYFRTVVNRSCGGQKDPE